MFASFYEDNVFDRPNEGSGRFILKENRMVG